MSDQLARLRAALASRYELIREIGSGGMATVYLAEDLRHRRKVAVKVLRPELAATVGTDRFLHEIEVAAQLQHPNILPLLDSGDSEGFLYYAMPFVEGQTLRDRLLREGELPIQATVKILAEVVDALVEAHRSGVIHRDIKPENVLLTGRHALVADFGVAKALNEATGRHRLTTAGVALGTPAYMAPEQATAEPHLDHRVDIYAVGVMAYEMLTGQTPFTGVSAQQILAAHVTQPIEPPARRRASIPPLLDAVVMKCLEKRPADRWQSAEELLAQLEPIAATPSGGVTPTATRPVPAVRPAEAGVRRWIVIGGVAGAALVAVAAAVFSGGREDRIELGPVTAATREPGIEMHPSLSPDGKLLAYTGGAILRTRVYVRSVAGGTPVELARDFDLAQQFPSWSPDGTRILFWSECSLFTVPNLGGVPEPVVRQRKGCLSRGTWSPSGNEIAFFDEDTLFVIPASGGARRELASGILEAHSPAWSPDGKWIAGVSGNLGFDMGNEILGNVAPSALVLVPAAGGQTVRLTDRRNLQTSPVWLPDSRHLLFMSTQDGGRDIYVLRLGRDGRPAGPPVRLTSGLNVATFHVSADGRALAYTAFDNLSNVWAIDIPAGAAVSSSAAHPVTSGTEHVEGVSVSPDRAWLAFDSDRAGTADIFIVPLAGGEPRRITTDPGFDFIPSFSPDGKEIAFQSWRNETRDVFVSGIDGAEQLVAGGPDMEMYPDWSPDGQRIVFYSTRPPAPHLYVTERGSDGSWTEPRAITASSGRDAFGVGGLPRWSPDGGAIVFACGGALCLIAPDGTGRRVLLEPRQFPGRPHNPIFADWSPDSRTIYVRAVDDSSQASFWAVPASGGTPRLLVRFDDPDRSPGRGEFATDGKRLYFTVDRRQSDIKLMPIGPAR